MTSTPIHVPTSIPPCQISAPGGSLDTTIAAEHDDPSKKYEVLGALDELLKIRRGRTRVALYERLDPTATAPSL